MNNLKKGFTLIELLIAIAIVMLIATLGVPKIREVLAQSKDAKAVGFLGSVRTVKSSLLMENTMEIGNEDGEVELSWDIIFNELDMKKEDYLDSGDAVLAGAYREDKKLKVNYDPKIFITSSINMVELRNKISNSNIKVKKSEKLHLWGTNKNRLYGSFDDSFYSVEGKKWTSY